LVTFVSIWFILTFLLLLCIICVRM
jgi:hypothetical protein